MLSNTIKWLVQVWGFFSLRSFDVLQLLSSTGHVFSKFSTGIKLTKSFTVTGDEQSLPILASSLLQPPLLVMVIAATGWGEVSPPGSLLLCWFR